MDLIDQLKILSQDMDLEPAEDQGCPQLGPAHRKDVVISRAILPNGQSIKLLKSLLTSACERNCYYCPFRSGRDFRRATFKSDDFASTFMSLVRAGIAQGTFLSSGIVGGGARTQDLLIDTAEILRRKYKFGGYLHLKIMPGAERDQVARAMQLADRVSINLEAPTDQRLQSLAPKKHFFDELMQPLRWVDEIRRSQPAHRGWNGGWPSTVTQFVVGAVGDTDLELLTTTEYLYRQLRLRRAYYSPFRPVSDTPLDHLLGTPVMRTHRLYQASFLLRDYGFGIDEVPFNPSGNLPLHTDPKLLWASEKLAWSPLEINRVSREELLRIPGIGPKGADKILATRHQNRLLDVSDLKRLGVNIQRAGPFVLINGRRPAYQRSFW